MTIEADKGESIYLAAERAVRAAKAAGTEVTLEFNEIKVRVHPLSFPADIASIYLFKSELRRLKS